MKSLSLDEIAKMQFKRKAGVDLNALNLDIHMFNVVNALDGDRDVGTIARQDGYELEELHQRVVRLQQLGVVELVNMKGRYLSEKMLNLLSLQLSESVGPISNLLLEDVAAEMGYGRHNIPVHEYKALVERLGDRINDNAQAEIFLQNMAAFQNLDE